MTTGDHGSSSLGLLAEALASTDPQTVWDALDSLDSSEEAARAVIAFLLEGGPTLGHEHVRRRAAKALADHPYGQLLVETSATTSNGVCANLWFREILADYLGLRGDPSALSSIEGLFNDDEDCVAIWAALAFAKIGEASLPAIRRQARSDRTTSTRLIYLLDALGRIRGDIAAEEAQRILGGDRVPQTPEVAEVYERARAKTEGIRNC